MFAAHRGQGWRRAASAQPHVSSALPLRQRIFLAGAVGSFQFALPPTSSSAIMPGTRTWAGPVPKLHPSGCGTGSGKGLFVLVDSRVLPWAFLWELTGRSLRSVVLA